MERHERRKRLGQLFLTFFRIGAFTFGGGYAMIPLIQRETVETRGWIREEDILDIVAIAESTPGPIAINSATFVGYRVAGVRGAACATLGVVLPSFAIILLAAEVLELLLVYKPVQYAFAGIRAGVLALILKAFWNMYKKCPKGLFSYLLAAAALLVAFLLDLNVLYIIVGCGVAGLLHSLATAGRAGK